MKLRLRNEKFSKTSSPFFSVKLKRWFHSLPKIFSFSNFRYKFFRENLNLTKTEMSDRLSKVSTDPVPNSCLLANSARHKVADKATQPPNPLWPEWIPKWKRFDFHTHNTPKLFLPKARLCVKSLLYTWPGPNGWQYANRKWNHDYRASIILVLIMQLMTARWRIRL